jgi:hypothetical protein
LVVVEYFPSNNTVLHDTTVVNVRNIYKPIDSDQKSKEIHVSSLVVEVVCASFVVDCENVVEFVVADSAVMVGCHRL